MNDIGSDIGVEPAITWSDGDRLHSLSRANRGHFVLTKLEQMNQIGVQLFDDRSFLRADRRSHQDVMQIYDETIMQLFTMICSSRRVVPRCGT